jgi:hypothetical protein
MGSNKATIFCDGMDMNQILVALIVYYLNTNQFIYFCYCTLLTNRDESIIIAY